jgi:hypothetical protein
MAKIEATPVVAFPPHKFLVEAIKIVHTLIWASIESCALYVLVGGLAGRSDRRVAFASTVVAAETAVFTANGFRCPLFEVTESLGARDWTVTDLYLPLIVARNLPAIHVAIILWAAYLHVRNLPHAAPSSPPWRRCATTQAPGQLAVGHLEHPGPVTFPRRGRNHAAMTLDR